ncbi:MAG: SPOR domain-containing protein [Planctomycetota bacterium]|nr:SPOR domain-containing protein [Planctomycetota bacterium]
MMRLLPSIPLLAGLAMFLLSGCESTPQAGSLDAAILSYEAGRYTLAHRQAGQAMHSAGAIERERATYLAGLSAYRLGRLDEAERLLLTAARSADAAMAAKARAGLGLIRLDQDRPAEAARLFQQAEADLSGADARQAARYADAACLQAGLPAPHPAHASPRVGRSTALETASNDATTFALQVGAFRDRRRAERAAAGADPVADEGGLGRVRIIPRFDDRGRRLYVVQLGSFTSRREAAAVRTRLRHSEYIVVPAADSARQ